MKNVFFGKQLFVEAFVTAKEPPSRNMYLGIPHFEKLQELYEFQLGVNTVQNYDSLATKEELAKLLIEGNHCEVISDLLSTIRLFLEVSHNSTHYLQRKVILDLKKVNLMRVALTESPYKAVVLAANLGEQLIEQSIAERFELIRRIQNQELTFNEEFEFKKRL